MAAEPGAVSDQQILTLPAHSCSSSKKLWQPFTQELVIPPSSPAKSCSFSSAPPKKHKHTHAQTFLYSSSSTFYCSGRIKIYDLSIQVIFLQLFHEAFCCSTLGNSWDTKPKVVPFAGTSAWLPPSQSCAWPRCCQSCVSCLQC